MQGGLIVIVDSTGRPVTSTISEIDGVYQVHGLIPGNYSAFAEPLDEPLIPGAVPSLVRMNPGTSPVVMPDCVKRWLNRGAKSRRHSPARLQRRVRFLKKASAEGLTVW